MSMIGKAPKCVAECGVLVWGCQESQRAGEDTDSGLPAVVVMMETKRGRGATTERSRG